MLEEAADDGAHADVLAHAGHAGTQSADAADDEVDGDAGLRCDVERVDDLVVEQRVHLGDDARGAAGAGVFSLAVDEGEEAVGEGERRDEQRAEVLRFGVGGEVVEDVVHGGGDGGVRGEQADVGVEARGDGVVVAGAEVGVAAELTVFIAADDRARACSAS